MTTDLHDPCNHVPEISPDDEWGDPLEYQGSRHITGTTLPPRRNLRENSDPSDSCPPDVGLRIEVGSKISTQIKRDVEFEVREISGEVLRLAPETEEIERAPRKIVFQPRPSRVRPDVATAGEGKEWGVEIRKSYRWMIVGGGLVVLSVATGLALQPLINKPSSNGGANFVSRVETEETIEGMDALNDMIVRQPEAEEIFSKFAKAADPDDYTPWIRDPVATEPLIRKHRHTWTVGPDWNPPKDCNWNVFASGGLPCATLEGSLPGFKNFSACFVIEENKLLLDWKATTGYGTATFDLLSKGSGDGAEIRGWLQPATYYTAVFPEADFAAFQLLPPDSADESTVWIYARRDTDEEQALTKIFPGGEIVETSNAPEKVTLKLQRGDPSSAPNQWLVVKLLHKQWISP